MGWVIGFGGIGARHTLVTRLGLDDALNENVLLLKTRVPYFESDHVLNISYNVLTGGTCMCLEDIDRLRDDASYADGLSAERIPEPITAGDFLRRFQAADIGRLQEAINQARGKVWSRERKSFFRQGIIDVDGTIAPTAARGWKPDPGQKEEGHFLDDLSDDTGAGKAAGEEDSGVLPPALRIENQGFRYLSQTWNIDRPVGHSYGAVLVSLVFVFMVFNAGQFFKQANRQRLDYAVQLKRMRH